MESVSEEKIMAPKHSFSLLLFLLLVAAPLPTMAPTRQERGLIHDGYLAVRQKMVEEQIRKRGISNPRILRAMARVPRHLFVPRKYRSLAYRDGPLPIGKGQTISQPYIVAFMTDALHTTPEDRVLEVGTGSGYQAAVLAEIVREVYTIEIIPELGEKASNRLKELGYRNAQVRIGDGYLGWPEKAPFDAIIVTAAPEQVPPALLDQLKEGGRLCLPVGSTGSLQSLVLFTKEGGRLKKEVLLPVRFVPMIHGE